MTPANQLDTDVLQGKVLLGFRVPTVIASPFTGGKPDNHRVSSLLFDHTSVLRLIEWRWGLKPLTPRDASSDLFNLAYALNFSHTDPTVPALPEPSAPPLGAPCPQALVGTLLNGLSPSTVWTQLGKLAAQHGFPVKDVI